MILGCNKGSFHHKALLYFHSHVECEQDSGPMEKSGSVCIPLTQNIEGIHGKVLQWTCGKMC